MQLVPRPDWNQSSPKPLDCAQEPTSSVVEEMRSPSETDDRVIIFIDGSNLFYAAMQLGLEIDYAKLLCYLTGKRRLLRAYFYTGVDRHNEKQQGFLLWMRRNGYRVVTKDLVQYPDGSKRANLDVEIAVDMVMLAKHCDVAVLLSGDGDLAYVVNHVAYQGTCVEVVSLPAMTNDGLIDVADRFIDLSAIRAQIQRSEPESRAHSVS
ncbi:NYN domain-containing protein [Myxacorys almedinensis]|uniref:NYN domain-containing protein n=1 Tax=Myxacorys almedinensis A TaxID=2690445 RepID=A0A8J7Z1U9_9CYAN|nr:NYN domain-containing protein [Myxacorys almedinensis]NDJ18517.1 NYN domain-containing protein [Myxacorys almedinensis A]